MQRSANYVSGLQTPLVVLRFSKVKAQHMTQLGTQHQRHTDPSGLAHAQILHHTDALRPVAKAP